MWRMENWKSWLLFLILGGDHLHFKGFGMHVNWVDSHLNSLDTSVGTSWTAQMIPTFSWFWDSTTVTAHSIFLLMFDELLWNIISLVLVWKLETWYLNHVGGVPIVKFETCSRKCSLWIFSVPITHVHCTSIAFSSLPCCGLTIISSIFEVVCVLSQEMHILNTVFLG